jgi:putative hydrolase of the HAD superfamily
MIDVIALDWGNTLMRDPGIYPGPMASWPHVEAVDGAAGALAALAAGRRLVVATNAADSGAALVLAALARVGLDRFFSDVFSSCEVGHEKPARAFYETMIERLACAPAQVAMVGDSYANDIAGARAAGLRTVWFNPARLPSPTTQAQHDAEVRTLAQLPAAIARLDGD